MSADLNPETVVDEADESGKTSKPSRSRFLSHWRFAMIGIGLAGLVSLLAFSLLGPQVGTVFSAVTKGLGGPVSSGNAGSVSATPAGNASQNQPWDRKIIRNATLRIEVNNVEQTLAQLRTLATSENGVVFKENTIQQDSDRTGGEIVLQVPGAAFESVVNRIRLTAAKVTYYESSSQDVTEEYVDLGSELANLRRTEEGMQKLVDKAQKLDEVLALQRELGNVRGEIEKRQGRLNFLDKRTAYSNITVTVSLPPVTTSPKASEAGWQPDKAVSEAWDASLKVIGKGALVVIRVTVFLWWLFPLLLLALIWWRVQRKRDYVPR